MVWNSHFTNTLHIPKQELFEIRQQVQTFFFFAPSGVKLCNALWLLNSSVCCPAAALLAHIYNADKWMHFKYSPYTWFSPQEPKLLTFRSRSEQTISCSYLKQFSRLEFFSPKFVLINSIYRYIFLFHLIIFTFKMYFMFIDWLIKC